jgi:hypothetical protein
MSQDVKYEADQDVAAQRLIRLAALGSALSLKRQAAIDFRSQSGIEQIWLEDEEFYMGIDDANREELSGTIEKPPTAGRQPQPASQQGLKSTVFPNITQPYVDSAAARIGDMLLPTDDRNFELDHTPIPKLAEVEDALDEAKNAPPLPAVPSPPASPPLPAAPLGAGAAEAGAPQAPPPPPPVMVTLPDGSQLPLAELTAKVLAIKATARRKAEKAQSRIDDWLTEASYHGHVRSAFDDAAKVGTGIIKGPYPVKCQRTVWKKGADGELRMEVMSEIVPTSSRVDYWNLFPDPACGENIHDGSWIFESDTITEKKLAELKGVPGYITSEIDECIEEGPTRYKAGSTKTPYSDQDKTEKTKYQIWYFHGQLKKEDIEAAGCTCDEGEVFDVLVTMVNDRVIRAARNPLDSGEFPYDVMRWKRRPNHWAGVGVARQMRTPQRMVVAATRNLMDNAGLGAGPMLVLGRGIIPQNGIWEIVPRKIWLRDQESDDRPVEQDMKMIVIPMLQNELTSIIQLGMRMAEDTTGMPMLLQGQQGGAPDTLGGQQMAVNNATAVLRRVARHFDNDLTIPHIQRYYDWLMYYGDDPEEKGDLYVKARGSSALVERDAQTQELTNIVGMTLNPAFGKNPKKAMDEFLKSRRFDPVTFDYTEEEQAKLDAMQPPPPPQIEVAKIRAAIDEKKIGSAEKLKAQELQVRMEDVQNDTDRDLTYVEAETERTRNEHQARMSELQLKRELAMLDYANKRDISLTQVKADLTKTALELRVQKELAGVDQVLKAKQVADAAIEPPGRAPDGEAFQK